MNARPRSAARRPWFRRRPAGTVPLATRPLGWLLVASALTLALHVHWLPGWASGLAALLLAWRGLLLWRQVGSGRPPGTPPTLLLLLITLAAGLGVRAEFGYFFGKDPGVSLLAILLTLKLLETRRASELRTAAMLCLFLQLAVFLELNSPLVALVVLIAAGLVLGALGSLLDEEADNAALLRSSALLIAQGLPLMLALFLLFPRIEGPLWGLPADAFSARTGLSDSMSPGSISQLGESAAIVMRARFEDEAPPRAQRYWRGPVFSHFDGRSWRAAPSRELAVPPALAAVPGASLDYQLTLEPHGQRWLLGLEHSRGDDPALRYSDDFRLLHQHPLNTRQRLQLRAFPAQPIGVAESDARLAQARQLPAGFNPRTRALAAELAAGARDDAEIVARALRHFREADLAYTLKPALLGRHSVDEFLFTTREGFCEHFASAFAFLLRAADVPVRIVTGYQGGELNPVDGNLVVRQLDAHAWTEVWLAGQGWQRIDPTYAAAPRRIDDGFAAALSDERLLPFSLRSNAGWLRQLRLNWEAATNAWNQRVLGYNPQRQAELLRQFGLDAKQYLRLFGLILLAASLSVLGALLWLHRRRPQPDPLARLWDDFSRRLAARGLARAPSEGPQAWGARLAAAAPHCSPQALAITAAYARLRYGAPGPSAAATRRAAIAALARQMRRYLKTIKQVPQ